MALLHRSCWPLVLYLLFMRRIHIIKLMYAANLALQGRLRKLKDWTERDLQHHFDDMYEKILERGYYYMCFDEELAKILQYMGYRIDVSEDGEEMTIRIEESHS
jgi:hypothetical protein